MKNKTVIGLIASPRGQNSNTLRLVKAVLSGAEAEGAKTECVDLYTQRIENCTGCSLCYATGECLILDDYSDLFDRLADADSIVFGAPNYIESIPGLMKTFFDRMSDPIHCQRLIGKFGCSVCTHGGSGDSEVIGYMNKVLTLLGVTVIGGIGAMIEKNLSELENAEVKARDLGKDLVRSMNGELTFPEQDAIHRMNREIFSQMVQSDKKRFAHEYDWYVENGWIN